MSKVIRLVWQERFIINKSVQICEIMSKCSHDNFPHLDAEFLGWIVRPRKTSTYSTRIIDIKCQRS
jgi:hypothetical protein